WAAKSGLNSPTREPRGHRPRRRDSSPSPSRADPRRRASDTLSLHSFDHKRTSLSGAGPSLQPRTRTLTRAQPSNRPCPHDEAARGVVLVECSPFEVRCVAATRAIIAMREWSTASSIRVASPFHGSSWRGDLPGPLAWRILVALAALSELHLGSRYPLGHFRGCFGLRLRFAVLPDLVGQLRTHCSRSSGA